MTVIVRFSNDALPLYWSVNVFEPAVRLVMTVVVLAWTAPVLLVDGRSRITARSSVAAYGSGEYGSVRSIFRAWMRSPEHRANILGEFSQVGIDLQTGTLSGSGRTSIWTQHFGSHCEEQPVQG